MKILGLIVTILTTVTSMAEDKLLTFQCVVLNSSGSFHSFIQPERGEQIEIPLSAPSTILDVHLGTGVINFSKRAYITLNGITQLMTSQIPRGSHDQGGWRISSEEPNQNFRIDVVNTNGKWLAWIVLSNFDELSPISFASMTCNIKNN